MLCSFIEISKAAILWNGSSYLEGSISDLWSGLLAFPWNQIYTKHSWNNRFILANEFQINIHLNHIKHAIKKENIVQDATTAEIIKSFNQILLLVICVSLLFLFCFYFLDKPEAEGKSAALQHLPTDLFVCLKLSHSALIIALTFSLLLTYPVTSTCQGESHDLWGCYLHILCLYSLTLHWASFILFKYARMPLYTFNVFPPGLFTENMLYCELSDHTSCVPKCLQITVMYVTADRWDNGRNVVMSYVMVVM